MSLAHFLLTLPIDEDVQALFERDHFVKLKKRLEKDDRRRMSVKEYTTLASEEGLTEEQATRLLKALNDAGKIPN